MPSHTPPVSAARPRSIGHKIGIGLLVLLGIMLLTSPVTVRTFVIQSFNMPSGSMEPTLLIGDYFLVSKFAYGYTRYSLPFSPPSFSGRVFAAEPQRGDVVVFRLPKDDAVDYVKRVIGLPGDRVQMIGGMLYLDGTPVQRARVDDYVGESSCGAGGISRIKRWKETLSNGVSYETLDCQDNGFLDNTPVYTVPAGHYFMLGDNRDNSTDSRVLAQVGYVPFDHLVGRVTSIFMSLDGGKNMRFERMGLKVH